MLFRHTCYPAIHATRHTRYLKITLVIQQKFKLSYKHGLP
jgi:hypothetical protein